MDTTTKITTIFDEDSQKLMTNDVYPLFSYGKEPIISYKQAKEITKVLFELKLNRYYDCIKKAKIVATAFGEHDIHLGSLFIDSTEQGVSYGYLYNPPLELHAWVNYRNMIIDFALAGTIEKGLITKDENGPFLVGRTPVILAGTPAPWMKYKVHEIVGINDLHTLNPETAKSLLYGNK